jgi:hypothetical protein
VLVLAGDDEGVPVGLADVPGVGTGVSLIKVGVKKLILGNADCDTAGVFVGV